MNNSNYGYYNDSPYILNGTDDSNNIPSINQVYKMRPSKIFNTMFLQPDIWQGYQSVPVIKNPQ